MLRPRRVRAGIPRMLDALCDQVLNPPHAPGTEGSDFTAHRICEMLHDYVGDTTGTLPPVAALRPTPPPAQVQPAILPTTTVPVAGDEAESADGTDAGPAELTATQNSDFVIAKCFAQRIKI